MSTTIKHYQRINIKVLEPECWKLVTSIEGYLAKTCLDKKLRELIKIRASQINKCAYCIDLHTSDAIKIGETERRIFALSAWEESPLFSNEERVILKLTEEITEITKEGVTAETFEAISKHFNENEIAQIIIAINHINFLNRIAVSTKMVHAI